MLYNNKDNRVDLQGIVSQVDLTNRVYTHEDGSQYEAINGTYTVLVEQNVNGQDVSLEVPVRVFATKYKKNSQDPNPAYLAAQTAMNDWTSIAMSDKEHATRISVSGSITLNEYPNRNGVIVSYPGVTASFPRVINKGECKPCANFSVKFTIAKMINEVDAEGVETGRILITGLVPMYGGKVVPIPFVASNPGVINALTSLWKVEDTVTAKGRLNFTVTTIKSESSVAFGEAEVREFTRTLSELVITGGSEPAEGDLAYDADELKQGLQIRQAELDRLKQRKAQSGADHAPGYGRTGAAPSTTASSKFADLGF